MRQGDGGPATEAWLSSPFGVAVDRHGNLYIGEYTGHRVRKVSAGGTITTLAGNGKAGFSGDGVRNLSQLYARPGWRWTDRGTSISPTNRTCVAQSERGGKITTFAGTGVNGFAGEGRRATSAQMSGAFGVAVDGRGNVYIADTGLARILKVAGGTLTRVAGRDPRRSGGLGEGGPANLAQMSAPFGVAVDKQGNVYIADGAYNTVRKVWKGRSPG